MPDGDELMTEGPMAEAGAAGHGGVGRTAEPAGVLSGDARTATAPPPGATGAHSPKRDEGEGHGVRPLGATWAGELSDRVIGGVAWVKARTTLRALTVLRAVVYGLVVVVALVTALVLLILGLVRLWDVYLPLSPLGRRVWLGYVVLGAAVSLAGVALLARRGARGQGQKG